ncbi:MAG TPA: hypothetical protein VK168_04780 [Saprospiraceae bacterium]|nr:hypothetical protein [Saprospiraceae bacterium]
MAFTRAIKDIIRYAPAELDSFDIILYEWIDNLHFTLDPKAHLDQAEDYVRKAQELFSKAGWNGDGEIRLMWIPPFMFTGARTEDFTNGVIVWHVKQQNDGISWILSPVKLPCQTEFDGA